MNANNVALALLLVMVIGSGCCLFYGYICAQRLKQQEEKR